MHITAQGPRLRNDLYCVEWDVKLYYSIPYLSGWGKYTKELATVLCHARVRTSGKN